MTEQLSIQQVQIVRARVQALYSSHREATQSDGPLARAFDELAVALEALRVVETELHSRQTQWIEERTALEQDCQRHRELFLHAPLAYLITGADGTMRQVNIAATKLLRTTERMLVGRAVANFVPAGQRRPFRAHLRASVQATEPQSWEQTLTLPDKTPLQVLITVEAVRNNTGQPNAMRWMMYDLGTPLQVVQELADGDGAE